MFCFTCSAAPKPIWRQCKDDFGKNNKKKGLTREQISCRFDLIYLMTILSILLLRYLCVFFIQLCAYLLKLFCRKFIFRFCRISIVVHRLPHVSLIGVTDWLDTTHSNWNSRLQLNYLPKTFLVLIYLIAITFLLVHVAWSFSIYLLVSVSLH